jgi:hypothetical protein
MTMMPLKLGLRLFGTLGVLLLPCATVQAADHFVRQGATGNGSGADWTNACPGFTGSCAVTSLVRGDTYWVADGSYGGLRLDRPGTGLISIKKATVASHGSSTGWQNAYGAGQATFAKLWFVTSSYLFDGQTRNEADWRDVASYGFRATGGVYASALDPGPTCPDQLTFRYIDVGGAPIGNTYSGSNPDGFYLGGFGDPCSNWTVSRSHIHNVAIAFQMAGAENALIEYSFIGPAWSKEAIRGQGLARGHIIRQNTMWNACQQDPSQGSGSACTAEIAGSYDGIKIYGNVIQKTTSEMNTGGAIVIGGDGTSWVGTSSSNSEAYNNTIVGIQNGTAAITINGGSANSVRNNVWAGLGSAVSTGTRANTTSNNVVLNTSAFVSYPTNLHLSLPTGAGFALPSPYNADRDTMVRGADGLWDLGAFEKSGVGTSAPAAPTNLRIIR